MSSEKSYEVLKDTTSVDDNLTELITSSKLPIQVAKRELEHTLIETSNHSVEVVDQIKSLSSITPKEVENFEKAKAFMVSSFTDVPQYRPLVTKLTSVLTDGKFPTADKKYWQCKSEAEVHFNELCRNNYKHRRAVIDLEELDYKITSIEKLLNQEIAGPQDAKLDPNLIRFDLDRLKIKREQYEFEIKQLEKNIKYRMKEITDWHQIASYIEPQCAYSTKNYEDHVPDSHYKVLEYRIKTASNEEERKIFEDQLLTFKNILSQSNKNKPK